MAGWQWPETMLNMKNAKLSLSLARIIDVRNIVLYPGQIIFRSE